MTKRGDTYYLNSHETCYAISKNIFKATDELQKVEIGEGFGVSGITNGSGLEYPNFAGIARNAAIRFRVSGISVGKIIVLADGEMAGSVETADTNGEFVEVVCPLTITEGKHDLTLNFEGEMTLDWFEVK